MSNPEHRVGVCGGKYTFVIPSGDYRVSILRYGELWYGPQAEASNALRSIMAELDAARVVLQAARALCDAFEKLPIDAAQALAMCGDAPVALVRALALHGRLVDDCEPPSARIITP